MTEASHEPDAARDDALVAHLMAQLEAEFGDRLDDAARAHIREQFVGIVAQGRALAVYPLAPVTEPAFTFSPPHIA